MSTAAAFEPRLDEYGPRIAVIPPYRVTEGRTAADLAQLVGIDLDQWQTNVLVDTMGQADEDGLPWAGRRVGILCSGNNGVEDITLARELYELTIASAPRRILHTTDHPHSAKTSHERLDHIFKNTKELRPHLKRITRASNDLRIELNNGSFISYVARTARAGRGFRADLLVIDTADYLSSSEYAAVIPTVITSSHPQVWMTGAAVDSRVNKHGVIFGKTRRLALAGLDPGLAWIEYSADDARYPDDDPDPDRRGRLVINPDDPEQWARANPGRIPRRYIHEEMHTFPPREFVTRRLGIGHWPAPDEEDAS